MRHQRREVAVDCPSDDRPLFDIDPETGGDDELLISAAALALGRWMDRNMQPMPEVA